MWPDSYCAIWERLYPRRPLNTETIGRQARISQQLHVLRILVIAVHSVPPGSDVLAPLVPAISGTR
jgi:hypothetical protein